MSRIFVVDIAALLLSSMGGNTRRGDNDEKKRGWLIDVRRGGATTKEKVNIYLLTVVDKLIIVARSCPMGILW